MRKLLFSLLCLIILHAGYSLNCYVCNSRHNESCMDPFSQKDHEPAVCDLKEAHCSKSVLPTGSKDHVIRGCVAEDFCKKGEAVRYKFCVVCNKDMCNDSSAAVPSLLLVFSMLQYFL